MFVAVLAGSTGTAREARDYAASIYWELNAVRSDDYEDVVVSTTGLWRGTASLALRLRRKKDARRGRVYSGCACLPELLEAFLNDELV